MNKLSEEIKQAIQKCEYENSDTYQKFLDRIEQGNLTRDENEASHFCTYFLPYNKDKNEVFFGHHKKSGLWLSPGGHIDKDETLLNTLNREIDEELGVKEFFKGDQIPFMYFVTSILSDTRACQYHFDLWYLMQTDGGNFNVDLTEFYDVKWLSIDEAKKITADPSNLKALSIF